MSGNSRGSARSSAGPCSAIGLLVALLAAGSARAEQPRRDPAAADVAFEDGKARLAVGDWAGACEKFRQSLELDPSVSTHVKIARCHERDGRLASALLEYQRALDLNRTHAPNPQREKQLASVIRTGMQGLEARVPRLQLIVSPRPNELAVSIDGAPVAWPIEGPLPVDPGEHELLLRAPGYQEHRMRVTASEAATTQISLALVVESPPAERRSLEPIAAPPLRRARSSPVAELERRPGSGQRVAAVVIGGVGVAALGVAGYYGIRTLALVDQARPYCDANDTCESKGADLIDRANDAQTAALVFTGVGIGLLGAGAALYFTAPARGGAEVATDSRIALTLRPTGASIGGSF